MSTDNHKSEQDETYIIVVGDQKDNERIDMKFMEDNDNDGVEGDDDTNNENKQSNENTKNGKSMINKPGRKSKKPLPVSATNKKTCCRLCLSYNCSKMIPLFGGTQLRFMNIDIVTVIESCIGLNVSEDDDLPNSICNVCLSRLENCWAFRQQCHKSDTLMHEINQAKKQFCELSKNSSSKSTGLKRNAQSTNKETLSRNKKKTKMMTSKKTDDTSSNIETTAIKKLEDENNEEEEEDDDIMHVKALIELLEETNKKFPPPKPEDEHLAFFKSLLPTVRLLKINTNINFRIHVMQALQDFKRQSDCSTDDPLSLCEPKTEWIDADEKFLPD